jgi:hypothetical protein
LNLEHGSPLVMIAIGGGEESYAIFDTGSQGAVVHIDYARAHGLPNEGPDYVVSPLGGDRIEGFRTTIREATLSGVAVPPFRAAAVPLDLGTPVAVISPDAFTGYLVTLDFAAAELRIFARDPKAPPRGVESAYGQDSLPAIDATIGGHTYSAHLDTGADHTLSMSLSMAAGLALAAPPRLSGRIESVGARLDVYTAQLRGDVTVGPLVLHDPEIEFVDTQHPHMNVGMGLVRRMQITLDPEQRRVWSTERPGAKP